MFLDDDIDGERYVEAMIRIVRELAHYKMKNTKCYNILFKA
jgi:hypothetical protein